MKSLLLYLLFLVGALAAPLAQATWNPEWAHRAKVQLDTSAEGAALQAPVTRPVVLVRLHTGNFPFIDAKPDGTDLRFIAGDDKTPLPFHIEKYDSVNELALIWVQLPLLPPGAKDSFLWIYHGNPKAVAASDPKTTFDATQLVVYHFDDADAPPRDSTANALNALRASGTATPAGQIGSGLSLQAGEGVALPAAPALRSGAGGLSVSMWLRPRSLPQTAALYEQREGANGLALLLRGDKLVARIGSTESAPLGTLKPEAWQHVALVAEPAGATVYLDGVALGKVAAPLAPIGGSVQVARGFAGEIDELRIAGAARSADDIRLMVASEGQEQRLVTSVRPDGAEAGGGGDASYLKILLDSLTLDGWVVVGILMVMMVISFFVMVNKAMLLARTQRDNDRFKGQFQRLLDAVQPGAAPPGPESRQQAVRIESEHASAPLYRLFRAGADELVKRFDAYAKLGREPVLTAQSISAIRATIDATLVRELQRLNSKMVLLTIAIAGGPFLGLLGTVVGVMITFAAIAAAGDVNVNAIAPGIAAALIATVAGLAVAIPALFGYNYLTSRIKDLSSDMHVFVDELVTKIAENHSV